jgi:periplasmic divalent cation tolerance protein
MTENIVILNTCSTEEEAARIARALIADGLAACVNVLPGARSFYRWKGEVEDAAEWLLIIKSSRRLFEAVRTAIEKTHSYEVPEIVALPIIESAPNYLNWMRESLRAE